MHMDVLDLRAFYYRTRLGRSAQRVLQSALTDLWPETGGHTVAGFGFAVPFLRPFLERSGRVIALMPGEQGVMHWPAGSANVCSLVEETRWPVETGGIDRLIVAHGLETCDSPDALLDEIWRVLAPEGRVIFIVPNRSGIWARRDGTPFGIGRPYSFGQLEALLRKRRFESDRHAAALYAPPSHGEFWLRTAHFWERMGRRFDPQFVAGAILIEARKHVYARPSGTASKVKVPGPLEVLEGLAGATPEPARQRREATSGRRARA